MRSITRGKSALGEVTLRLHHKGDIYAGRGISTDTIEASAKAYLEALNQHKRKMEMELDPKNLAVEERI